MLKKTLLFVLLFAVSAMAQVATISQWRSSWLRGRSTQSKPQTNTENTDKKTGERKSLFPGKKPFGL